MNIIYIAPMFHTNQVPIVKGWLNNKHQVTFISQYQGKTENHKYCSPIVLGYSGFFKIIWKMHSKLHAKALKNASYPEAFRDRYGFPPIFRLAKMIKKIKPDMVILRERSLYTIFSYLICRHHKTKCILYNQTPIWDYEPPRTDFAHQFVKKLTPSLRMTPVYGNPETGFFDSAAIYIPFVIEPHLAPDTKKYFQNEKINILCVGKYEERKHQLMLLTLFKNLKEVYPLHLTLVGEASTTYHQTYLNKINEYIGEAQLTDSVSVYVNQAPEHMPDFYKQSDIFVLPSTGEFASISQLEAMSYSIPVIVSDTNGTSCYVENKKNGCIFKDNDADSLQHALEFILSSRENILQMGARSYDLVMNKYSFTNYYEAISKL